MRFTADQVLDAFEIIKALADKGITIIDWDSRDIELQYPDGTRERLAGHYAAARVAEIVNA